MHSYQVKIIPFFAAPSILGTLLAENKWQFISFDFFFYFSTTFRDVCTTDSTTTSPLQPPSSSKASSQCTLQMYWYRYAPSLPGCPSLGPSPWRWEPVTWIQSLGNEQHQQQEQQCPVSAMVEQQRDGATGNFALRRGDINAFIVSQCWRLTTQQYT